MGTPNINIVSGSGIVQGTININVPTGTAIKQVLPYWGGKHTTATKRDQNYQRV